MSLPGYVPSNPRIGSRVNASHRIVFRQGSLLSDLAGGKNISGACSRDPGNTGDVDVLRPGMLMGRISTVVNSLGTVGSYAPSVIGASTGALTGSGTTLASSAAIATEIARRIGSTGSLKLTGPPTEAGTVRTLTAAYSAVNTSTGDITITALGVNEVQTFNFTNSPAGTFRLAIVDSAGTVQYTQRITYSSTIGTLLTNLQAATDAVLAANAIVWGGSVVTAVTATFSGTGYARMPQAMIVVDTDALTAGDVDVTRTTAGVDGRFVSGSLIQPTDGSESPITLIPDGYGVKVTDIDGSTNLEVPFSPFPIAGAVAASQILPSWPSDISLRAWIRDQLNAYGKFVLDYGY